MGSGDETECIAVRSCFLLVSVMSSWRLFLRSAAIYGRAAITFLAKKYPFALAIGPALPIAHYGLKARSRSRLEAPVLRTIEEGSRPTCIPSVRTRVTLCVAVLAQRATMPISCIELPVYA